MSPFFSGLLQTVADRGRALVGYRRSGPLSVERLLDLARKLLTGRGEASGIALARSILAGYADLAAGAEAGVSHRAPRRALVPISPLWPTPRASSSPILTRGKRPSLSEKAEPRRQELLRRLNHAPGGTLALVRMREDMIDAVERQARRWPRSTSDFVHLFASWFNRGFLVLRRIDWNTPANILEKIIRYEAVHAIDGWDDLRRRLEPADRRLYAFFHPALGDEPLIFVEVALTDSIPGGDRALARAGSQRTCRRRRRRRRFSIRSPTRSAACRGSVSAIS